MKQQEKFYISVPIYYVNGVPHIGHFYSTIIADCIARFNKIEGKNTKFVTGVDENSQKALQAAEKEGMEILPYLDKMAGIHKSVWDNLKINYTDFIRTTEQRHHIVVKDVLQTTFDRGDIYEGEYNGMYCIGCEAFKKDDDLIDHPDSLLTQEGNVMKVCPDHLKQPDQIKEKNYFFRLKKYQTWLEEFYKAQPNFVLPSDRFNEVIAFVERGLEDFSISRETNTFGIVLPFDTTQVTYVWFDALYNYYTSCVKSPSEHIEGDFVDESDFFPANVHVVGKDIIRFHAIYWPAMLASYFNLGEEIDGVLHYKHSDKEKLPKNILTTGFLTVDGQKMSKSLGNVIDPVEYSQGFSKDILTLYLLSGFNIGQDGDFDNKQALLHYNAKLANNFGNLVNRVVVLTLKGEADYLTSPTGKTLEQVTEYIKVFTQHMEAYNLKAALEESFTFLDILNKYVDETEPWKLIKADIQEANRVLYILAEGIRIVALHLYTFFPEKMGELFERIGLENYIQELEKGNLEELIERTEIFPITKMDGVLFERFEIE